MKSITCCFLLVLAPAYAYSQVLNDTVIRADNLHNYIRLGETHIDSVLQWWNGFNKEYRQGQVPYTNWKDRKAPLPWNYHAELIRDPEADLSTDRGRQFQARFVPGYRILISFGHHVFFNQYRNDELVFDSNRLISYTANVDTDYYKAVTHYVGPAETRVKTDTLRCEQPDTAGSYQYVLYQRQYTWTSGTARLEVTVTETLDKKCKRQRVAVLHMVDTIRYRRYLQLVEEQKKLLKKEFEGKT